MGSGVPCTSRKAEQEGAVTTVGRRSRIRSPKLPHTWQDLLAHSAATSRLPREEPGAGLTPRASVTCTDNFIVL